MQRIFAARLAPVIALAAFATVAAAPAPRVGSAPLALRIATGSPQTAHAFVAVNAKRFETSFPVALGVEGAGPDGTVIRFRCVSRDCTFAPSDQPDAVSRVDPRTYDVKSSGGKAALRVTLSTKTVGTFVAEATAAHGAANAVRFALAVR